MDNTTSVYPTQTVGTKKKFPKLIIAVIVILIAIVLGVVLFRRNSQTTETNISVTPTQEPSLTLTPTPQIDKQTVKIQVLNGTGTPGQASSAVDALKNAGYNQDNIKTGNAANYDQTVTTIAVKKEFLNTADDIKTSLASIFDNTTIDSTQLGSESEYDVIITTGGKKYEEPTEAPTSSPTGEPTDTLTPTVTLTPTGTSTPTPTPTP